MPCIPPEVTTSSFFPSLQVFSDVLFFLFLRPYKHKIKNNKIKAGKRLRIGLPACGCICYSPFFNKFLTVVESTAPFLTQL